MRYPALLQPNAATIIGYYDDDRSIERRGRGEKDGFNSAHPIRFEEFKD